MASVDDPETNARFAKSLGLEFPVLSDPSRETARRYGVVSDDAGYARRVTFYIDSHGTIRAVDREVDTGAHGADIAARLRELGFPPLGSKGGPRGGD
jgi:peroxiredoxin Q/BCP